MTEYDKLLIELLRDILKNGGYLLEEFIDDERIVQRYEILLD